MSPCGGYRDDLLSVLTTNLPTVLVPGRWEHFLFDSAEDLFM